jgi:hypothetical protein
MSLIKKAANIIKSHTCLNVSFRGIQKLRLETMDCGAKLRCGRL